MNTEFLLFLGYVLGALWMSSGNSYRGLPARRLIVAHGSNQQETASMGRESVPEDRTGAIDSDCSEFTAYRLWLEAL